MTIDRTVFRTIRIVFLVLSASLNGLTFAQVDFSDVQFLSEDARAKLGTSYNAAQGQKAVAITVSGAWGTSTRQKTLEEARQRALLNCEKFSARRTCFIYAENDSVVSITASDQMKGMLAPGRTVSGQWLVTAMGVNSSVELKIDQESVGKLKGLLTVFRWQGYGGCYGRYPADGFVVAPNKVVFVVHRDGPTSDCKGRVPMELDFKDGRLTGKYGSDVLADPDRSNNFVLQ